MQLSLLQFDTDRERDIDEIHTATAIYTVPAEIEALLDSLGWPETGKRLLDPGAGNGGVVIGALSRIALLPDDVATASTAVKGYEFHAGAAQAARQWVTAHLVERGWTPATAAHAASKIVEVRDFLLSPVPLGEYDVIATSPPAWRRVRLPPGYRSEFDATVAPHAQADLLYAYLQRSADVLAPGGLIGLIASDRFLLNRGSAELRRRLGEVFTVRNVRRLDSSSAFYRPKTRTKGTPPRIHPVALVLDPGAGGLPLGCAPFTLDGHISVDGVALAELAHIQLAPWLGPDGIFVVRDPSRFPATSLVPVVEPDDIHPTEDKLTGSTRWALLTDPTPPPPAVLQHLDNHLHRMPQRGRRTVRWMPPESFSHRLPLAVEAIMVPRIAKRLRAILLPPGVMPVAHNLVVVSGRPASTIAAWLNDPRVQAQADATALRLENGYASFTATGLRALIIPHDLLTQE